jgi:hypothetical protein
MTTRISAVKKGDLLVWRSDNQDSVYIRVTRVAADQSWADIRCFMWAVSWSKRQKLPLPASTSRYSWSQADLDRDAAQALAQDIPGYGSERGAR